MSWIGMAAGGASDAVSSIGSGIGSLYEAAGSRDAAKLYGEAANYSKIGGELKDLMLQRQAFQLSGAAQAAVGASGLKVSGSAAEVMRSNAQQAALSRGITDMNTHIQITSYQAQQAAANAATRAQTASGISSLAPIAIGLVAGILSDDRLKENIVLVRTRADGLNYYRFNYLDDKTAIFEGVLASEVKKLYPDAVLENDMGWHTVNYFLIGAQFRRVA